MSKKKRKSNGKKGDLWAEAKRRCRLNQEQVRMAQEMGMNPRKLIGNRPNPSEPWKGPVGEWIRDMYERRQEKAARKRERRAETGASPKPEPQAPRPAQPARPCRPKPPPKPPRDVEPVEEPIDPFAEVDDPFVSDSPAPKERRPFDPDHPFGGVNPWRAVGKRSPSEDDRAALQLELFEALDETEEQVRQEAVEDDHRNVERHRHFGEVAKCIAAAMAEISSVHRVVLFGSTALPLAREAPRWRKYRGLGLEIAHQCKDVDLAVWLDDLSCLRALQRARNVTVNEYCRATGFGVAQHQIEVFLLEHGTDRYLGRLCIFSACPKAGESECRVRGCGDPPHLRQHEDFTLKPEALAPERSVVLFDRGEPTEPETT